MKKKICFALAMILCLSGVACGKEKTELPDFEAGINEYTYSINSWYSPKTTKEQYDLYKAANFNEIILQGENVTDYEAALALCDEIGIAAYVDCANKLYNISTASKYNVYESYRGIYAYDEPFLEEVYSNGTMHCGINTVANYLEGFEDGNPGKDFIVNLNPIYSEQLIQQTNSTGGYQSYVDEYCFQIMDRITSGQKWLACDSYPLRKSGTQMKLYSGWLENLEYYSSTKQKYFSKGVSVKTNMFIQAMPFSSGFNVIPNYAMLSLQAYTCLAFGYDSITYFCYATPMVSEEFNEEQFALVDRNGEPTAIYDEAKRLNGEILNFDHYFMLFNDWQGVCPVVAKGRESKSNSSFNNLQAPLSISQLGAIENVVTSGDLLIGFVKDKNGNVAYWLVNYDETALKEEKEISVELTFNSDYNAAYGFIGGEKKEHSFGKGTLTLDLGAGEGAFIIPYYA